MVQFKVRLHVLIIERISFIFELVGPEGIVPRHQRVGALSLTCEIFYFLQFGFHGRIVSLVELRKEFSTVSGVPAMVRLRLIFGKVLASEYLGYFETDIGNVFKYLSIVKFASRCCVSCRGGIAIPLSPGWWNTS